MRTLLLVWLLTLSVPALAEEWASYSNSRFGYRIDIPPGFEGVGESDNGDGQLFHRPSRAQDLLIWGGNSLDGFEKEVGVNIRYAEADGWNLTYQAATPNWASFSAVFAKRVLYQRLITLCDGNQYAAFSLQYAQSDLAKMQAVVERLVASFQRSDGLC